jgi:hypothetical protein
MDKCQSLTTDIIGVRENERYTNYRPERKNGLDGSRTKPKRKILSKVEDVEQVVQLVTLTNM